MNTYKLEHFVKVAVVNSEVSDLDISLGPLIYPINSRILREWIML